MSWTPRGCDPRSRLLALQLVWHKRVNGQGLGEERSGISKLLVVLSVYLGSKTKERRCLIHVRVVRTGG
jgi:hypothetical protein